MSGFGYRNLGFGGGKFVADVFSIPYSLRLDGTSAYLTRTPDSAGSLKKWTFSCWIKRAGEDSNNQSLFNGGTDSTSPTDSYFGFNSDEKFYFLGLRVSTAIFRDFSAWMHVLVHLDTANATASQRFRVFINGDEITAWDTNTTITQDADYGINLAASHGIGRQGYGGSTYTAGYLAEIHFVDDALYGTSTFGETGDYGEWKPIEVAGVTYGTNGFYLDFGLSADSAAGLGKDQSGNDNDFTPNGLDTYDQMVDSPTNNFATLNPLVNTTAHTEGNLLATTSGSEWMAGVSSIGVTSGKWFMEMPYNSTTNIGLGITTDGNATAAGLIRNFMAGDPHVNAGQYSWYAGTSAIDYDYIAGGSRTQVDISTGNVGLGVGDVGGIALDADNMTVRFYKDGDAIDDARDLTDADLFVARDATSISSRGHLFFIVYGYQNYFQVNFGQGDPTGADNFTDSEGVGAFRYEPPSGYLALCTKHLPAEPITSAIANFKPLLYTGDGTADRAVTGVGFKPDLVWMKDTDTGTHHGVFDIIRGKDTRLTTNNTGGEDNQPMLESFDTDGFTTGDHHNTDSNVHVSWNWLAGNEVLGTGDFTQGDHASTCSRNVAAGFSIVNYAASGTAGTVGHGLSAAPDFIITTSRDQAGTARIVYFGDPTDYLRLNSTSARIDDANAWNDTAPTATVFSIGGDGGDTNNTGTTNQIAYVWHEVHGYSRTGTYVGNGNANGPFVYTGFEPAFTICKRIESASGANWLIHDNVRPSTGNPIDNYLASDTAGAEGVDHVGTSVDYVSNGFKMRGTDAATNASGGEYFFIAFASVPFKYSAGV